MRSQQPARLFLVRHAETEWNTAKVFQGHLDSNLTSIGLQQAERLALRLESEHLAAVYSSDQGRALRTAEVIASRAGLMAIRTAMLREIDCGDWTGKGYGEVSQAWPADHANWRDRPHLHRMPNGESVAEVQARALRFIDDVRTRHPGQAICAVTHNTVVRSIVCNLLGWPLEKLWEGPRQPNCAITLVDLYPDRPVLRRVGDTAHLDGLPVSAISFGQPAGGTV